MPNPLNVPITPPRVAFIDPRTGNVSREWYMFFLSLFQFTGGSSVSLDDLQKGPLALTIDEINTLVDKASENLRPSSESVVEQIAELRKQIEALEVQVRPELGTMSQLQQANLPWVTFDTTPQSLPTDIGTVAWDGGTTLGIQMTANVLQPVGEAQYFYIKADSTITKGQLIMFTGAVGASGVIKGAPATGLTDGQYLMGIAAEDIANNGFGLVASFGHVRGWNTTGAPVGETWVDGDILYYNPSIAGGLTKTQPTAPNVKATIAVVVNAAPAGSGDVFVRVSTGSVLGGTDSNVQFGTLANGDLIQYDSVLGYWKNVPASTLPVGTATNLAGGAAGSVPYQSAPNTTAMLPIGAAGRWLGSSGTLPQWNAPAALTKTDDTNVTLTLGGSASTALLNAASLTLGWTGQLAATRGGTGFGSYAVGDILYANTTTSLAKLPDVATGNALISGGVGVAPSWGKIELTTHVTGILPVANGGTGTSTAFTTGSIVFAGSSGVYTQNNNNFFWDNTNNRLGIGTATPSVQLHIAGSSTTALARIANTGAGAASFDGSGAGLELLAAGMNNGANKYAPAIKFGSTDTDFTTTNPKFGASIIASAAQTYSSDTTGGMNLEFWTAPVNPGTGSGLVERMRIDYSGNVGIGTTNPQAVLDLGNSTAGRAITWGGSTGTARYSSIFAAYSSGALVLGANTTGSTSADTYVSTYTGTVANNLIRLNNAGTTGIQFFTNGNSAQTAGSAFVPTERMRIDSSGNVGIGTASPATLLHVSGSSTTAIGRIASTGLGATSFDGSGAGLELLAAGMNTTSKYTPAIKFGSTDPDFTTTNPKFGASIIASAAQTYSSDTTGGMNLEFWTAPANPGTGSGLVQNMTLTSAGRLGISTAAPACSLDVTGGIQTSRTTVTSPATTDGNIFSGSYTPTLTNTTNITSSTASALYYTRVGNVVAVFGRVNITATATGNTLLGISLPIASALTTNGQVAGMGSLTSATVANNTFGKINADTTNARAQFQLNSTLTTDQTYAINFTYVVL